MPGTGAAGASYGDLLVTSLIVLAAVCIAAFVVVRLAGRLLATGRTRGAHLLDVVARLPLEPRRSLYVVEVAGKTLLVGTSEMGLSVLSELDGGEVRARMVPRQSFADLVRAAWSRRPRRDAPAPLVEPAAPPHIEPDAAATPRADAVAGPRADAVAGGRADAVAGPRADAAAPPRADAAAPTPRADAPASAIDE